LRVVFRVNVFGPSVSTATATLTWLSDDPRIQPKRTVRPMAAIVATPMTSLLMAASFADGLRHNTGEGVNPGLRIAGCRTTAGLTGC